MKITNDSTVIWLELGPGIYLCELPDLGGGPRFKVSIRFETESFPGGSYPNKEIVKKINEVVTGLQEWLRNPETKA